MKPFYLNFISGFKNFAMTSGMFGDSVGFPNMYGVNDTVLIKIENKGTSPQEVDILSTVQPTGVTVSTNTMQLSKFITRVQANPMHVKSIKISTNKEEQLLNPIIMSYTDAFGQQQSAQIIPETYKSSFQHNPNMVEIPNVDALLDVNSTITMVVNPKTMVTFTLKVEQLFKNKRNFYNFLNFLKTNRFRNFLKDITIRD